MVPKIFGRSSCHLCFVPSWKERRNVKIRSIELFRVFFRIYFLSFFFCFACNPFKVASGPQVTRETLTFPAVFDSLSLCFIPYLPCPPHLCSACTLTAENNITITNSPSSAPQTHSQGIICRERGYGEDKHVQRYAVYSLMLFAPRHEITCQFGLKLEPSNVILITWADVKEPTLCLFS